MVPKLVKILEEGSAEDREKAAREICQRRLSDLRPDLVILLDHQEDEVRETVSVVLGVLGGKNAESALETVSKNDMSTNVRIAAIISKQYAGKLTYEMMISEIRRFKMNSKVSEEETEPEEHVPVKEPVNAAKPKIVTLADLEEAAEASEPRRSLSELLTGRTRIIAALIAVLVLISVIVILSGDDREPFQQTSKVPQGSALVGDRIMDRIAAIAEFKSRWLNPENPDSRYPMTLELRSIAGDTYGSLFEKVYSNVLPTEAGMNVLGAFWRHINFGPGRMQNELDLMDRETSEELLLFPNIPGLNLALKAENGDLAFEDLFSTDSDLEIEIEIESVTIQ